MRVIYGKCAAVASLTRGRWVFCDIDTSIYPHLLRIIQTYPHTHTYNHLQCELNFHENVYQCYKLCISFQFGKMGIFFLAYLLECVFLYVNCIVLASTTFTVHICTVPIYFVERFLKALCNSAIGVLKHPVARVTYFCCSFFAVQRCMTIPICCEKTHTLFTCEMMTARFSNCNVGGNCII